MSDGEIRILTLCVVWGVVIAIILCTRHMGSNPKPTTYIYLKKRSESGDDWNVLHVTEGDELEMKALIAHGYEEFYQTTYLIERFQFNKDGVMIGLVAKDDC